MILNKIKTTLIIFLFIQLNLEAKNYIFNNLSKDTTIYVNYDKRIDSLYFKCDNSLEPLFLDSFYTIYTSCQYMLYSADTSFGSLISSFYDCTLYNNCFIKPIEVDSIMIVLHDYDPCPICKRSSNKLNKASDIQYDDSDHLALCFSRNNKIIKVFVDMFLNSINDKYLNHKTLQDNFIVLNNPSETCLNLILNKKDKIEELIIYDINGYIIYKNRNIMNNLIIKDIKLLTGFYFINIVEENNSYINKLLFIKR